MTFILIPSESLTLGVVRLIYSLRQGSRQNRSVMKLLALLVILMATLSLASCANKSFDREKYLEDYLDACLTMADEADKKAKLSQSNRQKKRPKPAESTAEIRDYRRRQTKFETEQMKAIPHKPLITVNPVVI